MLILFFNKEGMTNTKKQTLGKWGENFAANWLSARGYVIVERNYSCPAGEIDIVARQGETLSFIEVKTRSGWSGSAERSVGFVKRQHLTSTARYYCRQYNVNLLATSIRLEQVSIYCSRSENRAHIIKYMLA